MTIEGLRHSGNFVTNARPENWREGILRLEPNGKAPLFALTSMMKSQSSDDPHFHWWEKIMPSRRFALPAGAIGTGASITVTAGTPYQAGIRTGMIILIEQTGEICRVTADPTSGGTTLSVTRGLGAVAATSFDPSTAGNNPNVFVIGNMLPENSTMPTAVSFDPVEVFNYCQIFRDTLQMSRTAQNTRLRTGDQLKEAKRETLQLHSQGIEWAMFFGERVLSSGANGEPMRMMDGLIRQMSRNLPAGLPANVIDQAGANTNLTTLEGWMEQSLRYGSTEKMVFCGNQFMLEVQRIARTNSTWQLMQGQQEFGMDVVRLVSPFGTWVLKTHPLFNQIISGTTGGTPYRALASWGVILDMAQLTYRYVTGGDTQYQPKLQGNDVDGLASGYLTECGIELHFAAAHMTIKRIGPGVVG